MARVGLYLLPVVLTVYALVDCAINRDRAAPYAPRWIWLIGIVVVPIAGPLGWLLASRLTAPPSGRTGPRQRDRGPDDDPEFLRNLGNPKNGNPKNGHPTSGS